MDRTLHLLRGSWRLNGDGRHLLGNRASADESIEKIIGSLLGPGHEHTPSEQRLDFEPRHSFALLDDLTDDDESRPSLLRGLDHSGCILERRGHRSLLDSATSARDDHRGAGLAAGFDQFLGDLHRLVGSFEDHDGRTLVGQDRPVNGVVDIGEDVHLAGRPGCEGEARVGGDTGQSADTGCDLERHLRFAQRRDLRADGSVQYRVATHQAHDMVAGTVGLHDTLGSVSRLEG